MMMNAVDWTLIPKKWSMCAEMTLPWSTQVVCGMHQQAQKMCCLQRKFRSQNLPWLSSNLKIPSEYTFIKHTCKWIINPSTQRCVEIIQSKLFHCLRAIDRAISSNSHLKLELSNCTCLLHQKTLDQQWLSHLRDNILKLMCFCCCDKFEHQTFDTWWHNPQVHSIFLR